MGKYCKQCSKPPTKSKIITDPPSVALQIQQKLFDFNATAIPSGSVDAVQEIFRFHLVVGCKKT